MGGQHGFLHFNQGCASGILMAIVSLSTLEIQTKLPGVSALRKHPSGTELPGRISEKEFLCLGFKLGPRYK